MDQETNSLFKELLAYYAKKVMAFQKGGGSWSSSRVFSSDPSTTVHNVNLLSGFYDLIPNSDYKIALMDAADFLRQASLEGELSDLENAIFFRAICTAYAATGDERYLDLLGAMADVVLVRSPMISFSDRIKKVIYLASIYPKIPRGYRTRTKDYLRSVLEDLLERAKGEEELMAEYDILGITSALAILSHVLKRPGLWKKSEKVLGTWYDKNDQLGVHLENVLVPAYIFFGRSADEAELKRVTRLLKTKLVQFINNEDLSDIHILADLAAFRWSEVLTDEESSKYVPRLDEIVRSKFLEWVNPDGGWGDDYTYRATATAGISLYNAYFATGKEEFRESALEGGEFLKRNLWDASENHYYSMDKIAELFYLIYNDSGDDEYLILLENIHQKIQNSLASLRPTEKENLLWFSAMYIIVGYYLQEIAPDKESLGTRRRVSGVLTHLLDPVLYDSTFHPWLQATILSDYVVDEDERSYFEVFRPYLARMTIDEDTTISEELEFQRFFYTYKLPVNDALRNLAERRAATLLRKDIILNITNVITLAKLYWILEDVGPRE